MDGLVAVSFTRIQTLRNPFPQTVAVHDPTEQPPL